MQLHKICIHIPASMAGHGFFRRSREFCAQREELYVTRRVHKCDQEVVRVPLLWAWDGASSQARLHPSGLATEKHSSDLHPPPSSCFLEQVFPKSDISLLLSAVITESSFSLTVLFKEGSIFIPYSYRCACGYSFQELLIHVYVKPASAFC